MRIILSNKCRRPRWVALWLAVALLFPEMTVAQSPSPTEVQLWQSVKDSKDPNKIGAYLKAYPNGQFSKQARIQLLLLRTPSDKEYLARAGKRARLVPAGQLQLDGVAISCGPRPTILDSGLDDFQATYPGYIVLNPRLLARVSSAVKLWMYSQGCGMRTAGSDVQAADCFAVRQGRKQSWLTDKGMEEVCTFIGPAKGDAKHQPGTVRCDYMRKCFADWKGN